MQWSVLKQRLPTLQAAYCSCGAPPYAPPLQASRRRVGSGRLHGVTQFC